MKNVKRIYVCSPYTELIAKGDAHVRHAAIMTMSMANHYYQNERVELFSPVLANMYQCEHLNYEDVMKICFAQLKSCDEVFIASAEGPDEIRRSRGIALEMQYALSEGIPVVCNNPSVYGDLKKNARKGE